MKKASLAVARCAMIDYTGNMKDNDIHQVMSLLDDVCRKWQTPSVTVIAEHYKSAFHVLVSCIISLRTKDAVTAAASARLFTRADTPEKMVLLTPGEIGELIYPAGFYRTKGEQIHTICTRLLDEYDGNVPDSIEQLLLFKGVGRKTANLVMTLGHHRPGICVDFHGLGWTSRTTGLRPLARPSSCS